LYMQKKKRKNIRDFQSIHYLLCSRRAKYERYAYTYIVAEHIEAIK